MDIPSAAGGTSPISNVCSKEICVTDGNFNDHKSRALEKTTRAGKYSTDTTKRQWSWWLPKRYIFSTLSFLATTIAVALNTNLSITIVYMVNRNVSVTSVRDSNECMGTTEEYFESKTGELLWSSEMQGLAIAALYYGQLLSAVPGGRLAELWGGKKTLISLILSSSLLTLLLPVAAYWSLPVFIIIRFLTGVATGPAVPVLFYLLSQWIPVTERCFHASYILAGYGTGSFVAFITSGALCGTDLFGGWPSVFYFGGAAGLVWCIACYFLLFETPFEHPTISNSELRYISQGLEGGKTKQIKTIPWKAMATSVPLWTLAAGYFGQYWILGFFFTVQAYYMGTVLNLNSVTNGQLSCLPHLIRAIFACLCGYPADWALKKGLVGVAFIRKGATVINSVISTLGFVGIMLAGCDPALNTIFFTIGALTGDFLNFGVTMACLDIAPNLSGTVVGILNIMAIFPYFIIPTITGWITAHESSMVQWRLVYFITIGVITVSTLIFVIFGSLKPQSWGTLTEEDDPKGEGEEETKKY